MSSANDCGVFRITPSRYELGVTVEYTVFVNGEYIGSVSRRKIGFKMFWKGIRADRLFVPETEETPEAAAAEMIKIGDKFESAAIERRVNEEKIKRLRLDAMITTNSKIRAICDLALAGDAEAFAECLYIIGQNERERR